MFCHVYQIHDGKAAAIHQVNMIIGDKTDSKIRKKVVISKLVGCRANLLDHLRGSLGRIAFDREYGSSSSDHVEVDPKSGGVFFWDWVLGPVLGAEAIAFFF